MMFRSKFFLSSICISLLYLGLWCPSGFATTLIVENGQLMGADDVLVGASYYDVYFDDRSADQIFTISSSGINSTFKTVAEAVLASQALLDQVFIDEYDSDPTLTYGISSGVSYATIHTVFESHRAFVKTQTIRNYPIGGTDFVVGSNYWEPASNSFTVWSSYVYAVWTPTSGLSPVPEPATMILFGFGLLGLAGVSRRKRQ